MTQSPATVKAITFSKTGDVDVIEKTDQPFPQQGPGDVILKVRATIMRPLWLAMAYLPAAVGVGRVCWCQFHRHLFQERTLPYPPPRNHRDGSRWGDCRAPHRSSCIEPPRVQGKMLRHRGQRHRRTYNNRAFKFGPIILSYRA